MPLHSDFPFVKRKVPKNMDPNVRLFFVEQTGEVFTNYEEFCYRTLQCNSLSWTCELTGKTEMTYSEALECEKNAKKTLECFPEALKVPALYLASIAQSPDFEELVSKVFTFMEKHFFVNELVVPKTKSKWNLGKVLRVKNPKGASLQSPNKKSGQKRPRCTPPGWYEYEISASINGKGMQTTLTGSKLKRSDKFCLTKDVLSIFLRQNAVLNARGIWVIKGSVLRLYQIQLVKFDDIFCGDPPVFTWNNRHKQKIKHEIEPQNKISEGRKINGVHSRTNVDQVKAKRSVGKQTGQQNIQKYFSSSKTSPPVQSNLNETKSDEKANDAEKYLKVEPCRPASVLANCSDEENANSGEKLKVVSANDMKPSTRVAKKLFEKMEVCVDQEQDRTEIKQERGNSPDCRSSEKNKDSSHTKDSQKKTELNDLDPAQKEVITPRRKLKQTRMFENRSSPRVDENKKPSFSVLQKKGQNNTRGKRKQKIVGTLKPWVQTTRKEKNSSVASSSVMKSQTSSTTQTFKEKKKNWLEMQREIELREREKKQEERQKKKAKIEEEKLKFAKFMKEWRKHREDLLCEDLKPLPVPCEINCRIPNELFGDFMMVFEFLNSFSPVFKIKIPGGVTFELLEKAVVETEISGPLNDIVRVILAAIFDLQVAENGKPKNGVPIADLNLDDLYDDDDTPQEAISHPDTATGWCDVFQGVALHDIPITSTTVSEILRLHLLGSGGRAWDTTSKSLNYRSGYTNLDDPGLWFRMEKPSILLKLSQSHISELLVAEKLEILCCLINQILTYASVRERVEERCEQARQAKAGLRSLQVAEIKLQKEVTAQRIQEKKDAKLSLAKGSPKVSANQAMDEKQRLEKEMNKLKVDLQRKSIKVLPLAMSGQLLPLGSDRAHRKYWLFSSIPGLFVEYNPYEIGPCLSQPTPRALELSDTLTHVRKLFEEEGGHNSSDKENDSCDRDVTKPASASVKKMLGEQNSGVEVVNTGVQDEKENPITGAENVHDGELLLCTASDNCPVHCPSVSTSHWCFFSKREDVTALLGSLNDRGIRESALLRVLKQEEQRIVESVSQCPAHKLNPEKFQFTEGERKSTRQHPGYKPDSLNLKFPPDTPVSYIMEWTIRENLLELENKITYGGIGSLKVHDRKAWRKAIAAGQYDKQCDKLVWGFTMRSKETKESDSHIGEETMSEDDQLSSKNTGESTRVDCEGPPISQSARKLEEKMDVDEEENQNKTCALKEDCDNREKINQDPEDDCDLDDELSSSEDNEGKSLDKEDGISTLTNVPPPRNPVIKDLASAILQVGQSLDPRCLKKPLARQIGKKSRMKCWEVSLMNTINFSQLFIHHSTLENSINWVSSIYNSPCFVCDRRKNGNKMRFCDGCNKRFHMYCAKPKLRNIPEGSWQCQYCSPEESETIQEKKENISNVFTRRSTAEKKRKAAFDDEPEGHRSKIRRPTIDICKKCAKKGELVYCTACTMGYHSECTKSSRLSRQQKVNWLCDICKEEAQIELSNDKAYRKFEDETVDSAAEEPGDDSPENSSDESSREIRDESSDECINDNVKQNISKKTDKTVIQSSVVQAYLEPDDLITSPRERRGCASAARAKIASFTKRLRRNSWDDDNDTSQPSRVEASPSYCNIQDNSSIRRSSRRSLVASEDLPLDNAVLQDLLTEMLQQENAWPFLRPVRKAQVPDYHVKIKRPMDLGTIKYKLNTAEYKTNRDFIKDILLVFENCFMYNDRNTIEYHCGKTMLVFFEKRSLELGLNWKRQEMTAT